MKKLILIILLMFLPTIVFSDWQPPYRTRDRASMNNFDDISIYMVDNVSNQTVGGNKTFTGSTILSGSLSLTGAFNTTKMVTISTSAYISGNSIFGGANTHSGNNSFTGTNSFTKMVTISTSASISGNLWLSNSNRIFTSNPGVMDFYTNGRRMLSLNDTFDASFFGDLYLTSGKKYIFGTNTYWWESNPASADLYVNGTRFINATTGDNTITLFNDVIPSNTSKNLGSASYYWNVIHYHTLTSHSIKYISLKDATYIINNFKKETNSDYIDKKSLGKAYLKEYNGEDINMLISTLMTVVKEQGNMINKLKSRIEKLERK